MMPNLTGTRVVIIGASFDLGIETARALVAAGCRVVLGARREGRLREICDELGETATFLATDVTKNDTAICTCGLVQNRLWGGGRCARK